MKIGTHVVSNAAFLFTLSLKIRSRTIGAMVEALLCCIVGLSVGFVVAQGTLVLVEYYDDVKGNIMEAQVIALATLCVETFILAHIRAKWGNTRPAIATGTLLS